MKRIETLEDPCPTCVEGPTKVVLDLLWLRILKQEKDFDAEEY